MAVGESYHPMAVRGDLFHLLRQWAVAATILTAIVVFGLWLWRRPLAPRIYVIGLFVIGIISLIPLLPSIDSGYRQAYFLGDDKYEIPWQYGPYNGDPERGGQYFLVKVSVANLAPKYETQEDTIIIGMAVDFNYGTGGGAPEEICLVDNYNFSCQWQLGNSVFMASGEAKLFPSDVSGLLASAPDLLQSFKVSAP